MTSEIGTRETRPSAPNIANAAIPSAPMRGPMLIALPGGQRGSLMLLVPPPGINVSQLMNEGDAVSNCEVQKWFKDANLAPDGEIIEIFTLTVNQMRISVHAADWQQNVDTTLFDEFKRALNVIEAYAPPAILKQEALFANCEAKGLTPTYPRESLTALSDLLQAAQRVRSYLVPGRPKKRIAAWHQDAAYLAFHLDAFAQRNKRRLSFSKPTSPGVKVIVEALKRARVAGLPENLDEALAQAMKRRKANPIPLDEVSFSGGQP